MNIFKNHFKRVRTYYCHRSDTSDDGLIATSQFQNDSLYSTIQFSLEMATRKKGAL